MMKKKVVLWLSGWVDSAVSAALLLQQWYEVVGWFMKNYVSDNQKIIKSNIIQYLGNPTKQPN